MTAPLIENEEEYNTTIPVKTDLERAYDALLAKRDSYTRYFEYYDGEAPMPYASARLREVFQGLSVDIQENWASVVVNAAAERINLEDIEVEGGNSDRMKLLVDETELLLEMDDTVLSALITGEGFLVAWKDEGDSEIEVYNHDPRMCHVFYESDKPRSKDFACKWWYDDERYRVRMILYYSDHIEYYSSEERCLDTEKQQVEIKSWRDFERDPEFPDDVDNPYGVVPVFHLRTGRRRAISQLKPVIPMQDAINMAVINMAVNGEYSSAPQKYVITNAEIRGRLRNSPEIIWELPAGDGAGQGTSVGQFTATDMNNFVAQIQHYISSLAVISRTPKHYFDSSGAPSGESLIVQEAPLVKKCDKLIARFEVEVRALGEFLLLLDGKKVDKGKIKPKFSDTQSTMPLTDADIKTKEAAVIETKQRIGISRKQALIELGYTEDEIEEMDKDKQKEAELAQEQLMKSMDQGGGGFTLPGSDMSGKDGQPLAGAAAVTKAADKVKPSAT